MGGERADEGSCGRYGVQHGLLFNALSVLLWAGLDSLEFGLC